MSENIVIEAPIEEKIVETDPIKAENETDTTLENNPYAYLDRPEFSAEKFKIEIRNLPRFYGIPQLRKLLNETLKLNSSKVKTPKKNCSYAFVCLRNDEDRDNALKILHGYKWKGNELTAMKAKPCADPLLKKRKDDDEAESNNKKIKLDSRSVEEKLKQSTISLCDLPYKEQLIKKQGDTKGILKRLASELGYQNRNLTPWLDRQKAKYNGLPCELLNIRHAEKYDAYRNKCEFTVGINEETDEKTVGFRIGSYSDAIVGVGPVQNLRHIPDSMKIAAKVYEKFVRNSNLQVFNPIDQSGQFKQLTARSAKDQLMLIVGISQKDLDSERIELFKKELIAFFSEGDGKEAKVTSLYYEKLEKRVSGENNETKAEHLYGETHIFETIHGLKFRISPDSFFQVNTEGAEVLYSAAMELAGPTLESTVLDICCGTGTIGLCFAKACNQVLGLEIVPEAIEDAKQNAIENNITNAEFFAGKAEEILYSVFKRSKTDDVIAIVDPPRAGLHNKAVTSLRKIEKLQKLVYIACNAKQAMKNFTDLGRAESKTMHGNPFVPIKAVAVDMFPHTPHCELIIFFQRYEAVQNTESK